MRRQICGNVLGIRPLELARATHRYEGRLEQRLELHLHIREMAETRVRYGYRMIRILLNREDWQVGKDLMYRLYKKKGWDCVNGQLDDGVQ